MIVRELDLDLDAFEGPFDLLLTLVLKEELNLAEIDVAGIVLGWNFGEGHLHPRPVERRPGALDARGRAQRAGQVGGSRQQRDLARRQWP